MTAASEPVQPPDAGPGGADAAPRYRVGLMRLVLFLIVAAVVAAVALVPLVASSLRLELFGREAERLYGFPDAEPITPGAARAIQSDSGFYNLSILDVDEAKGSATLGFSGDRLCDRFPCPESKVMIVAYNGDPTLRRGLPASATIRVGEGDAMFSDTFDLPVEGWPGLYPFDTYHLRLGVIAVDRIDGEWRVRAVGADGPQEVGAIQNGTRGLLMDPPTPVPVASVMAPSDWTAPMGVLDVELRRPAYLRALAVALVSLVAISALASLTTSTPTEALLGLGSLVLGVWGVRSVLVPNGFGAVTAVDIALSLVILLLLVGLGIRAAVHVSRSSGLTRHRTG